MNRPRNSALRSATPRIRSTAIARWLSVCAGALPLLAVGACTNATGNIQGGQYILPVIDAGVVETSAPTGLMLPANCTDGGANAGNRWQDLYACYFGPSGVASCAGTPGNCHGDANGAGAQITNFVCPMGDPTGCLMSMQSYPLFAAGQAAPMTPLFSILRQTADNTCPGNVCMPLEPQDLVFGPDDMARIGAWIDAGIPNN